MISGTKELTKGGAFKKPLPTFVVQWVKDECCNIISDMIIHSFKKCCISNSIDGFEDDALFEEFIGGCINSDLHSSTLTEEDYYCDGLGAQSINIL